MKLYCTDINGIFISEIEINEADAIPPFCTSIEPPVGNFVYFCWSKHEWIVADKVPDTFILDARANAKARINLECDNQIKQLSIEYPEREILSWDQQTKEAEEFLKDNNASVPHIKAIAESRGVPLEVLATRVLEKRDAYAVASGVLIGHRQKLEDLISKSEDLDFLNQLNWGDLSE